MATHPVRFCGFQQGLPKVRVPFPSESTLAARKSSLLWSRNISLQEADKHKLATNQCLFSVCKPSFHPFWEKSVHFRNLGYHWQFIVKLYR